LLHFSDILEKNTVEVEEMTTMPCTVLVRIIQNLNLLYPSMDLLESDVSAPSWTPVRCRSVGAPCGGQLRNKAWPAWEAGLVVDLTC